MSEETETYEQIDRFLDGLLEGAEKQQFEQRLATDPEFRNLVEAQSVVNEIIIGDELLDIRDQISKDLNPGKGNTKWWIGAVLLFSLIGAGIIFYPRNPNADKSDMVQHKVEYKSENVISSNEEKNASVTQTESSPEKITKSVKPLTPSNDVIKTEKDPVVKEEQSPYIKLPEQTLASAEKKEEKKKEETSSKEVVKPAEKASKQAEMEVTEPEKKKSFQYAPAYDGTWKLPLKENASGTFKLLNKGGIVVYETRIQNGSPSEWDGAGNKGIEIIPGLYLYFVEYQDGTADQGTLTIIQ